MAEQGIDLATLRSLVQDGTLDLRKRGLSVVPPEIGLLEDVRHVDLKDNNLTVLPPEICRLKDLVSLDVTGNRLTELPPAIGDLRKLRYLGVRWNQLQTLPMELGELSKLEQLWLTGNSLTELPASIAELQSLTELHASYNQLHRLPSQIGWLHKLQVLDLRHNQLTDLVPEIGRILGLTLTLHLDDNPLRDPLPELLGRGVESLKIYLESLQGDAVSSYEAKVLLVGEGNVGKTSLVAALADEPFVANRSTTHGIEIHRLLLRHPTERIAMTVYAWDFGGQEVYRITHQFFFGKRALYLLVWNAREGQEQNEVVGWLRRIKLRVGSGVRVLIIATHSDERRPELDYPALDRKFPGMLAGQFAVDNRSGSGIPQLRGSMAAEAALLPQMGQTLSNRWVKARDAVLEMATDHPHIPFATFSSICLAKGMTDDEVSTLCDLMHDVGQIIYYGDDEGLRDIVVLNPEWLTKAIGRVLEDGPTRAAKGVLDHTRFAQIWGTPSGDSMSYSAENFPYFVRLMEKFDVSYRLDDEPSRSLVAQLAPYERPDLPWQPESAVGDQQRSISLLCRLSEPAPGLIAWMTVRHHNASVGRHWRAGVFMRHPIGEYASEALLELRREDEVSLEVRAPSPDMFFNVLRDSLENLIRRRWPGLHYDLSVPCPGVDEDGAACDGRFPLKGLLRFRERGGERQNCLECQSDFDVFRLLTGFEPPDGLLQPQFDRLHQRLAEVSDNVQEMRAISADTANSLRRLIVATSVEVTDCPRFFTISQVAGSRWSMTKAALDHYKIVLWCEQPGEWHPWSPATYTINQPREWVIGIAPYANLVLKALKLLVPIGGAVAGVVMSDQQLKEATQEIKLMNTLVEKLPEQVRTERDLSDATDSFDQLTIPQGAALRTLRILLLEQDARREFGDLRRIPSPSGEFLWVCPAHHKEYDPGLPTIPRQRAVEPRRAVG